MIRRTIVMAMLLGCVYAGNTQTKSRIVDSMINWVNGQHKYDSLYIKTLHSISYRLSETDVKASFNYYQRAAFLSDSLHFTYGKALAQINLGILLANSANFEASNNAYFRAIEFSEQCHAMRLKSAALNNIGENFRILTDYDKSRQYTREAIELNFQMSLAKGITAAMQNSFYRGIAINYEQLQQCDILEKKYREAEQDLDFGMPFALKANDPYVFSQYYLGYGKVHAATGDYDSAAIYFDKSLQQAQVQNDLGNVHKVYLAKAEFQKDLTAAQQLDNLDSALVIAKNTNYLKGVADAADQLSRVYDRLNNKDSALYFFRVYRTASDSVFSENNKRNVLVKEAEWTIQQKEFENDHLKRITELQGKELKFKNGLLVAGIVVLILSLALSILVFQSFRSRKKRDEAIQRQQEAELKNQVTELEFKAFKAQLNPHFIFNYLNSVSGYILMSQPEKASQMIKKFSKMLRNVLQSSEMSTVSLRDDMHTIEQYLELMQEITTPVFSYTVFADEEVLEQTRMVPPLFIQPYVENAIVHGIRQSAGSGLFLEVLYRKKGEALVVTVTDNGTGFDSRQLERSRQFDKSRIHLGLPVSEKRIMVFSEKNNYISSVAFSTPSPGSAQPGSRVTVLIDGLFRPQIAALHGQVEEVATT